MPISSLPLGLSGYQAQGAQWALGGSATFGWMAQSTAAQQVGAGDGRLGTWVERLCMGLGWATLQLLPRECLS